MPWEKRFGHRDRDTISLESDALHGVASAEARLIHGNKDLLIDHDQRSISLHRGQHSNYCKRSVGFFDFGNPFRSYAVKTCG